MTLSSVRSVTKQPPQSQRHRNSLSSRSGGQLVDQLAERVCAVPRSRPRLTGLLSRKIPLSFAEADPLGQQEKTERVGAH